MSQFLNILSRFRRNQAIVTDQPLPSVTNGEPNTLIDLRQVVKAYKTPAGTFTALKGVDLQVRAGEFVAVIGKSGSGKSTLINMITGIDRPTAGEVIINNVPIHDLNENQMARWRKRNLGVIFQFFQLLPTLTVLENIVLPMELAHTFGSNTEREEWAMHLLELVGLAPQADKFPSAISGGQQQRVAIARSLANDPDVIVADEPTGSLDSKTADEIFQLFEDFVSQGKTLLMVTHDRELAGRIPRIVFITDGEIADQYVAEALPTLNKQELAQMSAKLEPVKYAPGETIIQQGDQADSLYIIVKGEAEVFIDHQEKGTLAIDHLRKGQYFGEIGLIEGGTRTATVKASQEAETIVMQLDRETFMNLVDNSDKSKDEILRLMRERVTNTHISQTLSLFSPDELGTLTDNPEARRTYAPGEIITKFGDPAKEFYIIISGVVDVINHRPDGREDVVNQLGEGQFFGEVGLIRRAKRMETVRASQDQQVEVAIIDRETFKQLMDEHDLSTTELTRLLSRRQLSSALDEYMPELRRRKRKINPVIDELFGEGSDDT